MQDRYAGDVGDFGKLALLRALTPGRRLGIGWYRPDALGEANNDGRHLGYLERPKRFRHLDPEVFDGLSALARAIQQGRTSRSVASLEELLLLPQDTLFHRQLCPAVAVDRRAWAAEMRRTLDGADLVFLDPDNGLEGLELTPKSVALAELGELKRPGRALLLYHHQTRMRGGADVEAPHVAGRLRDAGFSTIDAVRLRPYSSRFYFLVDGDAVLRERLAAFAAQWGQKAQLYSALGAA